MNQQTITTRPPSNEKKQGIGRLLRGRLAPVCLILIGVVALLYPIVSTNFNNYQIGKAADEYSKFIEKADTSLVEEKLDAARDYNRNRTTGPILDPWLSRISEDNKDYQEYLSQLDLHEVMARITIPSLGVELPVFHGTRDDTLSRGAGHLYGSDLPVGGADAHSVITAHSGLPTATMFDDLHKLKSGDSIYIDVYGQRLRYVVSASQVVQPDETDSLGPIPRADALTLITCTPYGINSHRLLVHAQRAPLENAGMEQMSGFKVPVWMIIFGSVALAALIGLGVWLYRLSKVNSAKYEDGTV